MTTTRNGGNLLGNDFRNISPEVIEILSNKEVIALNQDPLGVQGYKRLFELCSHERKGLGIPSKTLVPITMTT
jgi:hypothetical protein